MGRDPVAQERYLSLSKGTLSGPPNEAVFLQAPEDRAEMMTFMLLEIRANHQYIIKIYKHVQEPLQDAIHEVLKHLSSISQAKWHLQELLEPTLGGCLAEAPVVVAEALGGLAVASALP